MEYIENSKRKSIIKGSINSFRLTPLILLAFRVAVILLCLVLASGSRVQHIPWIFSYSIILCFGVYQILSSLLYLQAVKHGPCRLLLSCADTAISLTVIYLTGGFNSPYLAALAIPVSTMVYKQNGFDRPTNPSS